MALSRSSTCSFFYALFRKVQPVNRIGSSGRLNLHFAVHNKKVEVEKYFESQAADFQLVKFRQLL
jgi:hypothetical protein